MNKVLFEKVNCSLSMGLHTIFTNIVHIHPHWHDEIEIIFVCGGDLLVNIQGIQKQIHKGDIAVVSSGEIHSVNSCNDNKDNIVFILQMNNQFAKGLGLDPESCRFVSFPSGKKDQMAEYLDEIRKLLLLGINELVKMEKAYASMIHSHCAHILSLLLRHFLKNDTDFGDHDQVSITDQGQQRLKRVVTYINEHYQDNPTLEEIAGIACLSPSYFSRSFNTITGMTYSQYLNIVKISMVQQDLLDSGDSVLDIMLRHGFSNVKTFNRVFKINTGFSPSAYRKYMQGFHDENNWMQTGNEKHDRKYAGGIIPDSRLGSYVNFRNAIEIPDDLFHEYLYDKEKTDISESSSDLTGTFSIESISNASILNLRHIVLDSLEPHNKLDPYFCFMSAVGRAGDLLREGVRKQIRIVQKEIGFKYLRFHGILNDEIGIFPAGNHVYNFTYLDEIFDFLLEVNLKPFVEFSYMPGGLASGTQTKFIYNANVSIPNDWNAWRNLIAAFMEHIVKRYSLEEVESWYFEVWNEPNFTSDWAGSFDDYMKLYKLTVLAVKEVSAKSKVGGPALSGLTAKGSSAFLLKFLETCGKEKLPLDFVSSHPYPSTFQFMGDELYETSYHPLQTRDEILWLKDTVKFSSYPEAELQLDEWNSSPVEQDFIHDTAFMATFIIKNYLACQGLASSLGYWAVSDIFEEFKILKAEFNGGFGLLNKSGLKKPQYHAFAILKRLGSEILSQGDDYIVTQKSDASGRSDTIQVLVWNYVHYSQRFSAGDKTGLDYYQRYGIFEKGEEINFRIKIPNPGFSSCLMEKIIFNREHGSIFDFWLKNGALEYPQAEYLTFLDKHCLPLCSFSILKPEETISIEALVPPFGFVFFEVKNI